MPLAVAIYGYDVRVISDPAMLDRVVYERMSKDAWRGAQRISRLGELAGSGALSYGELAIDTCSRVVTYASIPVVLRRREYALLAHMAGDPERVWARHELLRDVWGFRSNGTTRTVDTHASRLRGKLAAVGAVGWMASVWGVGYRLAP